MIRGKVARVLTTRELVINRGKEDGVILGMRFAVMDPKSENITDPDTGGVLGSIARPKVYVEVTRVEPHLSLAATFRKRRTNVGGLGGISSLGRLFEPPIWVDEYDTFKASDAAWEDLAESESFVKVGDPVVELGQREQELQVGDRKSGIQDAAAPMTPQDKTPPRRGTRTGTTKPSPSSDQG